MRMFDVQGIEIDAPGKKVFEFLRVSGNLPRWAHAFSSAGNGRAQLVTPAGTVDIALDVSANAEAGTVDWRLEFPDGTVGVAQSRVTETTRGTLLDRCCGLVADHPVSRARSECRRRGATGRSPRPLPRILCNVGSHLAASDCPLRTPSCRRTVGSTLRRPPSRAPCASTSSRVRVACSRTDASSCRPRRHRVHSAQRGSRSRGARIGTDTWRRTPQ